MREILEDTDFEELFIEMIGKMQKQWFFRPTSRDAVLRRLEKCGIKRSANRDLAIEVFIAGGLLKFHKKEVFYITDHRMETIYYNINWAWVSTKSTPIPMLGP